MNKVQSSFYEEWANERIKLSITSDVVLDNEKEIIGVDVTSNAVEITLPDATSSEITNGKKIRVYEDGGDAGVNNITVVSNPGDSTTIGGFLSYTISTDDGAVIFELLNNVWMVFVDSVAISLQKIILDNEGHIVIDNDDNIILTI